MSPSFIVVDNFLPDPLNVRARALAATFEQRRQDYKGWRSVERNLDLVDPAVLGKLLGVTVSDWETEPMNTKFQVCTADDAIVYHSDTQRWAGVIYLNLEAPIEAGTSFWRSRATQLRRCPEEYEVRCEMYDNKLLDPTAWDLVDRVGNVFNRLVLWDSQLVHSASCYFGHNTESGRLTLNMFFNGE